MYIYIYISCIYSIYIWTLWISEIILIGSSMLPVYFASQSKIQRMHSAYRCTASQPPLRLRSYRFLAVHVIACIPHTEVQPRSLEKYSIEKDREVVKRCEEVSSDLAMSSLAILAAIVTICHSAQSLSSHCLCAMWPIGSFDFSTQFTP